MLGRCVASVYRQTLEPEAHLVLAQSCAEGLPPPVHCAYMQNALLPSVTTTWTMRLADDDRLLPNHLAFYMEVLVADATDVLYSWDATGNRPRVDCTDWRQSALVEELARRNWIDGSAVAIRTALLLGIGGWPTEHIGHPPFAGHFVPAPTSAITCEDWAAFYLLAKAGARFRCLPAVTWEYGSGPWPRISTGS
jgi:hypothetical protein